MLFVLKFLFYFVLFICKNKAFYVKITQKTTFLNFFLATKKDFTLHLYLCIVKTRKYG